MVEFGYTFSLVQVEVFIFKKSDVEKIRGGHVLVITAD